MFRGYSEKKLRLSSIYRCFLYFKYILYIPSKKQELILLFKEKKIKGI